MGAGLAQVTGFRKALMIQRPLGREHHCSAVSHNPSSPHLCILTVSRDARRHSRRTQGKEGRPASPSDPPGRGELTGGSIALQLCLVGGGEAWPPYFGLCRGAAASTAP